MAQPEWWDVKGDISTEIWAKLIGKREEDPIETKLQAQKILRGIPEGKCCVEIGAGVGRLLAHMGRHFKLCLGVDYSPSLVNLSRKYLKEYGAHVRVMLNDGAHLPLHDETIDFVYSFTCFQHMTDHIIARSNIREAFRVLRPGGFCRIQVVRGNPMERGRYDGIVFVDNDQIADAFTDAGFKEILASSEGEWIWVTARKT